MDGQEKKLSDDILVEEVPGFIRLCYVENGGTKSNEIFMDEKEAQNLKEFLIKFDYENLRRHEKWRKES